MRIIGAEQITQTVAELCIKANICVGDDIYSAIKRHRQNETLDTARFVLDALMENADVAKSNKLPICQDTGMAVVFVTIGNNVHINGDIHEAVNEGVRLGYKNGYFRSSVVSDPIRRINTGDNTPAVIYADFMPGDDISITVAPKGFGSENMSGVRMLSPSDGLSGIAYDVAPFIPSFQ